MGAGFSLNAIPKVGTTTPFPMWRELVRAMFDQLHPFVPGVSNAQELNDSFNRSNWLRVASEFEAAFGATKLDHLIRTQIPDASYIPGSLHEKLMKLQDRRLHYELRYAAGTNASNRTRLHSNQHSYSTL